MVIFRRTIATSGPNSLIVPLNGSNDCGDHKAAVLVARYLISVTKQMINYTVISRLSSVILADSKRVQHYLANNLHMDSSAHSFMASAKIAHYEGNSNEVRPS